MDLDSPELYLSRELSKLAFNERVLHEAVDDRNPTLERVKFLSILTENMDEFFMKRVGGLKQQIAAGVTERTPDGRTPKEQWKDIIEKAEPLLERQAECYRNQIRPALGEAGIKINDYGELSASERRDIDSYFEQSVLPTLTPLTFDPAHPFPHISNLSLSLAVLTAEDEQDEPTFSRVKIPQNQPRLVRVHDTSRFVFLEDVIAGNLDELFPDVTVQDCSLFRLTRNAKVKKEDEVAEDLIEKTEKILEQRRFATVVRLEVEKDMPEYTEQLLKSKLDIGEKEVFRLSGRIDYRGVRLLTDLDRPDLKLDKWRPQPHPRLAERRSDRESNIFAEIRRDDILVHHPYHSFDSTVQRLIDEAAQDPDVLAIKATIYRTASDSKVVQSLIDASQNGKQVAVMVELKARFDEKDNLRWAKTLEEEGIHVAYGTTGYKTHTKTILVVREENDGARLYSHIGTGNYNSETAKRYEDIGLLTARRDIGRDLVRVFNYFTGHSRHTEYQKLLIAPGNMRQRFVDLIRREAEHARDGRDARIVAKVNRLEDPELVRELYEASQAGVDIDLIVRDICRLRPGVNDISENINVISIVNRFLEHSRVFYFYDNGTERYYIGSADWMTRNLDNRVEAVTPIRDPSLKRRLQHILDTNLTDNAKSWEMQSNGRYIQRKPEDDTVKNAQEIFMREAERGLSGHES